MRSEKGHRNRKNPGSAEFYQKQRKEQNAARPKQERIESTLEIGNTKIVKIIGPFREQS
jgi:hypothetical protein